MPLGNLELLKLRVAGYADDLHPVPQGRRNGVQHIGCGYEKDLGKIKGYFQIVVCKGVVLLWVENFQKRRRRISPEIRSELINLVKDNDWIAAAHRLHGLDNPPGHGADISAPVPPDFRLIPHSAQ